MRNKVLAGFFGGLLLIAAASPAPTQTDQLTQVIVFCDSGLKMVRSGRVEPVQQAFDKMPPEAAKAVAVVCKAYTAGYDQGQRDYIKNMT